MGGGKRLAQPSTGCDVSVRNRNPSSTGQSSSRFAMSSASTWSTGVHEPAGIVQVEGSRRQSRDFSVMWQIEHNGPWEWEVGEDDPWFAHQRVRTGISGPPLVYGAG